MKRNIMKKKSLVVFFTVAILFILTTLTAAAAENINVYVDGTKVTFTDVFPYEENGRTMVPVRAIAETMGAEVQWDGVTETVTLKKGNFVSTLKIGSFDIVISNGNEKVKKSMDVRSITRNDRTYIPARFVGYALGYDVEWKDNSVHYSYIDKQTTDFEIDPNSKFPNKYRPYNNDELIYSYYDGYGDVKVINGDDGSLEFSNYDVYGNPVYRYVGNFIRYKHIPYNYIFDSEEFDISLDKPVESLENFKKVFDEKCREKSLGEYYTDLNFYSLKLSYNTYEGVANIGYSDDNRNNSSYPVDFNWNINNCYPRIDMSMYYYNAGDGVYLPGIKKTNDILQIGSDKNTLLLLHTFLGNTGERIWQMMSDYLTNSGLQSLQNKVYIDEFNWKKPPIDENITNMYGFQFISNEKVTDRGYFLTIYDHSLNKNIKIHYMPITITEEIPCYSILW